mmetsp:Transcript_29288/g.29654  ORF Transcript_29288/g.29654 Transcript_29288/m.29654 type:complete len:152 (-) Transcript_29288:133-588(-)
MSFYDIIEKRADGSDISFSDFSGKVVYGVNVASECGKTAAGYNFISKVLGIDGVVVVLFPCNQFGGQEPGSNAEICSFIESKGSAGAIVLDKADVNGPNTRPTYNFLKSTAGMPEVRWNFAGKFLVDKTGNISVLDDYNQIESEILRLVAE